MKFSNEIITAEMLSRVFLFSASLKRFTIDFPHYLWMSENYEWLTVFHIDLITSLFDNTSKIPSPKIIKSWNKKEINSLIK
jgi:hypothetical protein